MTYTYTPLTITNPLTQLPTDMLSPYIVAIVDKQPAEVYRLTLNGEGNVGIALYLPNIERIAITYGGDAEWSTAESAEEGIELYHSDFDEYEARN